MPPLPTCRWRGASQGELHLCRSTKFVGAPNTVPGEFCHRCYYIDHEPPPPPPRLLPCVHLGEPTGATVDCPTCTGHVRLKLFACTLHEECVPTRAGDARTGPRACSGCPDYLQREPGTPSSAAMLEKAEAFLAAIPDYPAARYHGRGVVIAGGGERYFASLYVTIRALRHAGCRLPIQVWYLGRNDEMPPDRQALLAPLGVECVDADAVRLTHPARRLDGWELKAFAVLHSPFAEVLFLDADCYPCRNPEFLFDLPDYRQAGAIFWPDMATVDIRLKWPAFGVADPKRPGSVESGQFVVNKETCWRPLNLAWFYNDHSDYYYRYGYGDKHTFEVAWARCGRPFVMWQPQAHWADVAYLHPGPDGQPLFVHRCADKFRLKPEQYTTAQRDAGPAFRPQLPLEAECWGWLADLLSHLGRESTAAPARLIRTGLPGHFNGSLIAHGGRLLLASRWGWLGARIYLSELGPDFQPVRTWPLALAHPSAPSGCEDPRLFVHDGRLHCAFTGLQDDGRERRIHQLVCRLDDAGQVEETWQPEYAARTAWEKNWQFFEHDGALHSVYSVWPHVVLRHDGRHTAEAGRTWPRLPWTADHLRGGAPPVRVGDEFYHFFHTMSERGGHKHYTAGLYTFAARPPFEVRRVARAPILQPTAHDLPAGLAASVVFPAGAVRHGDRWALSYGCHDHECRIALFDAAAIERLLEPVRADEPLALRPETVDRAVFESVALRNEYRLPDRLDGALVLDIGAHVGSFAYACVARGAAEVWCVEAEPGNCALLRRNLHGLAAPDPCRILFGAAWRSDRPATTLRIRGGGYNTGGCWVTTDAGAETPALPFDDLLRRITDDGQRRVTLLKLDCEGSEFPILYTSRLLSLVDAICGEYHLGARHHPPVHVDGFAIDQHELRRLLDANGFAVELTDPDEFGLGHFWARRPNEAIRR